MSVSITFKRKTLVTIVLAMLLLLFGIGLYFAYVKYIQPAIAEKKRKDEIALVANQEFSKDDFPPIQDPEDAGIMPNIQFSFNNPEYSFFATSVGKPAFTFSFFFHKDWEMVKRDMENIFFKDADNNVNYGIIALKRENLDNALNCEDIVKKEFETSGKISNITNKSVTIYDVEWDRVEFDVVIEDVSYHGITQCLNRPENIFEYYILATKDVLEKDNKMLKIMDQIKVSSTGQSW